MKRAVLGNSNVKAIGKAGYESREEMIKQMGYVENYTMRKKGIRKSTFSRLKVGHFIIQYDISNPKKIKVPKFLLGNKHSMSDAQWKKVLDYQRKYKYALPFYTNSDYWENKNTNLLHSEGRNKLLAGKEQQLLSRRKFRSNLR